MEYSGEYNLDQDYESTSFNNGSTFPYQYRASQPADTTSGFYSTEMERVDSNGSDVRFYLEDQSTVTNAMNYSAQSSYGAGMNALYGPGDDYTSEIKLEPGGFDDAPEESDSTLSIEHILAYTPQELEDAADYITKTAAFLLGSNSFNPANTQFITTWAIQQRARTPEEARQAIQDILEEHLFHYYQVPIPLLLEEAACQLQCYVDGPAKQDICRYTILCALQKVRGGDSTTSTEQRQTSTRLPEKALHRCLVEGCNKVFGRSADLERHDKMIHTDEKSRKSYYCDYSRCPRHTTPFFRQDHFRDHYRDQHYEDLVRRSVKSDKKWWQIRAIAVGKRWFRCNRCLVQRVDIAKYGFSCPGCGHACEQERQKHRREVLGLPVDQ